MAECEEERKKRANESEKRKAGHEKRLEAKAYR